jgi:DNA-binding protein HU-beta
LTKKELAALVATQADVTQAVAEKALSAMIDGITGALKAGEDVAIIGFGTFKVSQRAARTGRNPKTGEALEIAASKSATFSAGKGLKKAVNDD